VAPLPVVNIAVPARQGSLHYGMGRIDASGRVSDKSILRALRWRHGQPLQITAIEGSRRSAPAPGRGVRGAEQPVRGATGTGAATLWPAPGRSGAAGRRPEHGVLVVHPPSALDTMITTYHTSLLEGDGDEHTSR
jgi:hypothetical protein